MKGRVLCVGMVASLAAGCAHAGTDSAAPNRDPHATPPSPRSAEQLASCVERLRRPQPAGVTPATPQSSPIAKALDDMRRENDELRREHTPDEALFRDRRPLGTDVATANQACADRVLRELTLMSGLKRYDADSVRQVLDGASLTDITVRPGSGGLVFAGWTGQACVFGEYRPDHITAGAGDVIVGGGCLPD